MVLKKKKIIHTKEETKTVLILPLNGLTNSVDIKLSQKVIKIKSKLQLPHVLFQLVLKLTSNSNSTVVVSSTLKPVKEHLMI